MEGETDMNKEVVTSWLFHSVPPHRPHPRRFTPASKRDVPELPDWNIICKQQNWFITLHRVCPALVFCFTPAGRVLSWE